MRYFQMFAVLCFMGLLSTAGHAVDYTNTVDEAITGANACGTNDLIKTINVPHNYTISDVNLGFQAEHTWRGDINMRLRSPAGTIVQLISPNTGASGNIDNYNVLLDDDAATLINTAPHNTPDGTVAPPYENLVRPNNPLSNFNGENAQGDWDILICDAFPGSDNGEFDIATLSLIPEPSPPAPSLTCPPAEQSTFVWGPAGDANGWAAGTLANNYTIGQTPMAITVSGDTGFLIPRNGVATPVTNTEFTGGGATQNTLALYVNFPSETNAITLSMDLGDPGTGVESVTFNIFDIDLGGWIDRVTVTGSLGGVNVPTTLTSSESNFISNNQIIGTETVISTSGDANAAVTFTSAVDKITLIYDNDPAVAANPAAQIMSFFADMALCPVPMAELTAVKSVSVFDPGNVGLYMTPGNEVLYTITVNNSDTATAEAEDIDLSDTLPDNVRFISATTTGFTGGAFGAPALPAANTDCDSGACVIRFSGATLPINTTGEIQVRVLIK